jgi:prepilin-type N-terminal cleavage/methylation domain-containing protein
LKKYHLHLKSIKVRSDAGFSLLECIIALAMLSVALGWLSNLFLQQRINSLTNESTTGSVKVAQTILDDIRQRNLLKVPSATYVLGSGPYQQVCKKSTTVAEDPNYLCPGGGIAATREQELNQIFGSYYQATVTFCPYDLETASQYDNKKCTADSRYIKVEILDTRRNGADKEKYTTESFFTRFRE